MNDEQLDYYELNARTAIRCNHYVNPEHELELVLEVRRLQALIQTMSKEIPPKWEDGPAPRPYYHYHISEEKIQAIMNVLAKYERPMTQRAIEDVLCRNREMIEHWTGLSWQEYLTASSPHELAAWIVGTVEYSKSED